MSEKCRSCGAPILWAITNRGKRIPLDAEPTFRGNMVVEAKSVEQNGHMVEQLHANVVSPLFDSKQNRYMPHHASCPDAKRWRR